MGRREGREIVCALLPGMRRSYLTFHALHVLHLRQGRMRVVEQRGEDDGGGEGEGEVGGVVVVRDGKVRGVGCGCHTYWRNVPV